MGPFPSLDSFANTRNSAEMAVRSGVLALLHVYSLFLIAGNVSSDITVLMMSA